MADDGFEADTHRGDFDSAFAAARFRVDQTYSTPAMQPYPMEPHATTAVWHGDRLTVYDSDQGGAPVQAALADLFGLAPGAVNVVAEHVGGTPSATSSQYRRCTDRNGLCRPINTPQRRGVAITP